jgi:hypothetical protein
MRCRVRRDLAICELTTTDGPHPQPEPGLVVGNAGGLQPQLTSIDDSSMIVNHFDCEGLSPLNGKLGNEGLPRLGSPTYHDRAQVLVRELRTW